MPILIKYNILLSSFLLVSFLACTQNLYNINLCMLDMYISVPESISCYYPCIQIYTQCTDTEMPFVVVWFFKDLTFWEKLHQHFLMLDHSTVRAITFSLFLIKH